MSAELDQVAKAVAEFDRVAAGVGALQKTYGGVIYEVATAQGMAAAKEARLAIREPRFGIEKIRAAAKAPILELGRKLDSEAKRITAELLKIEDPIQAQIANEEQRKEREKQARIDAELKRVADIQERIQELRGNQMLTAGSGSELLAEHLSDLQGLPIDESFAEFQQQATDAKATGILRLRELYAAALAQEAAQVRIAAEREELARLRAEQERRDSVERARIAEEQRIAREAQAEANRKEAEANRLERERIAAEREKLERDQAALRAAQPPAPIPSLGHGMKHKAPSADEIVQVLAQHYATRDKVVRKWLAAIQWTEAA